MNKHHLRLCPLFLAAAWLSTATLVHANVLDVIVEGSTYRAGTGYRLPPSPSPEIIDAPRTPTLSISPDRSTIALLGRNNLPPIAELAEPELALAGDRINPRTNGPSRASFYRSLTLQQMETGEQREVPLPEDIRMGAPQWSPNGEWLAFTHTADDGIELWVVHLSSAEPRQLLGPVLNATRGASFLWAPDSQSLLVQQILPGRGEPPRPGRVATGPVVQENKGPAAPVRTYQHLLTNRHDEELFDYYFSSQLTEVPLHGGPSFAVGQPGIIGGFNLSPDGRYILESRTKRPYSYLAPAFAFASEVNVLDRSGRLVHQVYDRPQVTLPPIGRDRVNTGPRSIQWRNDADATLVWTEAMDGGDPRTEAEVRDRVFTLEAPFQGQPQVLVDLDQRFSAIQWGRDDLALVTSLWRTTSRTKTLVVNPSQPGTTARLLWDRSAEDRYGNPGSPLTTPTATGNRVLLLSDDGHSLFLRGDGASPRGDFPFLDRLHLETGETERLWQSEDSHYESVVALLDNQGHILLTQRESMDEPPNYFLRDLPTDTLIAVTQFTDPAPQLAGIQREIITYPREDGVLLSARLFTPPGYDREKDGPLPVLFWAYPREFRDAEAASQIMDSPNRFSRPWGSSPLFLLSQGYAILDGPAIPIIGVGEEEPNDTYILQLVSSARAAVDKVVEMGVGDRDRMAVAGHSYGAFMAANLLAHSDLFRAGIARSGAYNRTLTPFGFQAEPRSYWEAQEVYRQMSPFNHAHQVTAPVLLIHGAEDNNSGTFPVQSERMFQALKGNGTVSRLVMLPHESHGYVARESVLHVLAETIDWLDEHVKRPLGDPEPTE
jgi:dipeptidyl aminopeptidase/acylaminoacyl peptidase